MKRVLIAAFLSVPVLNCTPAREPFDNSMDQPSGAEASEIERVTTGTTDEQITHTRVNDTVNPEPTTRPTAREPGSDAPTECVFSTTTAAAAAPRSKILATRCNLTRLILLNGPTVVGGKRVTYLEGSASQPRRPNL